MSEHDEQALVVQWARTMEAKHPELGMLLAIPNGAALTSQAQANKLKAEGLKPGAPDLFLAVPRGKCSGMFVEMKFGRNKPSDEQKAFMQQLANYGYYVCVCWGGRTAVEEICNYLGIEKPAWA